MIFKYKVINPEGKSQEGKIEALSQDLAIKVLQEKGFIIVSVEKIKDESEKKNTDIFSNISFFKKKIKEKDIVIFSRQISTLFSSGVSALRAFRLVSSETENIELKNILNSIGDDIQVGNSVSFSLSKYDYLFGTFYSNMVRAGEESGKLDESFNYLADYIDRNYELSQKIKKATVYPIFVISTFIIVMIVMTVFVIPNLGKLITEQGGQLPLLTRIVLGTGTFLKKFGVFLFIGFGILSFYLRSYIKTEAGKAYFDYIKLKIPVFNNLFRKIFLARLTDNLDTMLSAGVNIIRSLEITSNVVDNIVFKEIIERVEKKVKGGKSLSQAFYEEEDLPNVLVQMTKIGEETGKLGYTFRNLSTFYKREVSTAIDSAIALIEPALIIGLAGGVGVLIGSILVPMYSVISNI